MKLQNLKFATCQTDPLIFTFGTTCHIINNISEQYFHFDQKLDITLIMNKPCKEQLITCIDLFGGPLNDLQNNSNKSYKNE